MAWTQSNKTGGEDVAGLGTQAWNIADGFSKIKILRLLIQLDLDEELAKFGRKDDLDQVPQEQIPYNRVEAFERFLFHLKQLMGNCKFSIEKGYDEMIVSQFMIRIEQVELVADGVASTYFNDLTKEDKLVINENHFKNCFTVLQNIKDELNFPLNRASLIFRQTDTLNIDEIMRHVEEGE